MDRRGHHHPPSHRRHHRRCPVHRFTGSIEAISVARTAQRASFGPQYGLKRGRSAVDAVLVVIMDRFDHTRGLRIVCRHSAHAVARAEHYERCSTGVASEDLAQLQ